MALQRLNTEPKVAIVSAAQASRKDAPGPGVSFMGNTPDLE
jgi:hypothetical protein